MSRPAAPGPLGRLLNALWGQAYVLLPLCSLLWAGNVIVGRAARDVAPPAALTFWRCLIAGLIVLPIAAPRLARDWPELVRRWKVVLALSFSGLVMFGWLNYVALAHTTAINAALLQSAIPPTILLCAFLFWRQKTRPVQMLGVLISVVGVAAIVAQGVPANLLRLQLNLGDIVMLVGVVAYAVYSVLLRSRPAVHPLSLLAATFLCAAVLMVPIYAVEAAFGARVELGPKAIGAFAYIALFPSLLSYLLFNRGVQLIGPGRAGQFIHLVPVFAAVLAILFLGERLHLYHLVGVVLVGLGIVLASRAGGEGAE